MDKVFCCCQCKWYDNGFHASPAGPFWVPATCDAPGNMEDTSCAPKSRRKQKPADLNERNDCPHWEPHWSTKVARWWRRVTKQC